MNKTNTDPHWPAWVKRFSWVDGLAFLLSAALLSSIFWALETRRLTAERANALSVATDNAVAIELRLRRLMSAGYLMAAVVKSTNGQEIGLQELLDRTIPFYTGIASLSLSPGGIIRYAAPLEPNLSSIGFNQLADPVQGPEALRAREAGELTMAGPLQLAQGGLGVVGRLPIFLESPDATSDTFWGFANVAVRLPEAFIGIRLDGLGGLGYRFHLYTTDPVTGTTLTIAESADVAAETPWRNPVIKTVNVPNAEWRLAVEPLDGWLTTADLVAGIIGILGLSALMTLLAHLLQGQVRYRRELEAKVQARTQEIEAAQQDLQATLATVPDLMMELDATGRIIRMHAHDPSDLLTPIEEALGKNIDEWLPAEALSVVRKALDDASHSGRAAGRHYALPLKKGMQWFELSIAAKSGLPSIEPKETKRFVALARNITARKLSELQHQLSAEFFNGSSEGMLITDAEQRIVQVNPAFTTITGYSAAEALGNNPKMLSSGRQNADFYAQMWHDIRNKGHWAGEIWNLRRSGEEYPQWLSITRIANASGITTHYVAIFSDMSRRREQEARIRALAYYDPLTGLANRALLQDRVQHDLSMAKRRKVPLCLLFIDLDHFKHVNDSLGHQTGDQLLIQIGQRIQSAVREQDTVARLGGDEFMVLLPDTSADGVANMARGLLKRLSQPHWVGNQELSVTPSIGVALYPDDGEDFESLYRCADSAMYRAKSEGRNRFAFFTPEMQSTSMRRFQLENGLRKAIERQELYLHFQPQVNLVDNRLMGAEVLLRWQHPEWGLVTPGEFIPIAESSGQIIAIGEWVLRQAVQQAQAWRQQGLPDLKIAVNLSAVQFRQPDLSRWVADLLASTGWPAHCLELELTESTAMHKPEEAVPTIQALRDLGIQLSLDDFGTGHSSLSYLKRFSINKLKIDQSFVQGLPGDPDDASIVQTIIQMADGLDLETIAEGVETEDQLAFLRQHGCEQMQGYLLARPLGAKDFESWWRTRLSANA